MDGVEDILKGKTVKMKCLTTEPNCKKNQKMAMIWKNFDEMVTRFEIKGEEKIAWLKQIKHSANIF